MKKLKKKTWWILVIVAFLLAVILISLIPFTSNPLTNILIIFLVIVFIALTILVQIASFQTFKTKPKLRNYPQKDYIGKFDDLKNNLLKNKYKERKTPYGGSFLMISGDTAYKCVLVLDIESYFGQTEQDTENIPANKKLDECKRFVGLEIFSCVDEANLLKIQDFTFQGKNVYYTALLYQENDLFKCINYQEPEGEFKEAFEELLSHIEVKEKTEE